MQKRLVLYADEGKVVTDGSTTYGEQIFLEVGKDDSGFYEITKEEYEKQIKISQNSASEGEQ